MNNNKRNTIKLVSGLGLGSMMYGTQWTKPIINSVVTPAHAQTSVANQPPVGQNFTIDALNDSSLIITMAARVSDPDGDPVTIDIVASGPISGNPGTVIATLSGLDITVRGRDTGGGGTGNASAFVDYTVSDGVATSTVYRITINNLSFPDVT